MLTKGSLGKLLVKISARGRREELLNGVRHSLQFLEKNFVSSSAVLLLRKELERLEAKKGETKMKLQNEKKEELVTVIFSAFREDASLLENIKKHRRLLSSLGNYGLKGKEVYGSYLGKEEVSILVSLNKNSSSYYKLLTSLASNYHQECVLIVTEACNAHLLFANGTRENLGAFVKVTEEEARASFGFTEIEGEFFICREIFFPPKTKEEINLVKATVEI